MKRGDGTLPCGIDVIIKIDSMTCYVGHTKKTDSSGGCYWRVASVVQCGDRPGCLLVKNEVPGFIKNA